VGIHTVTGRIEKDQLGIAAPHEHILIDMSNQFREPDKVPEKALAYEKIEMKHLGILSRNPHAMVDNLIINDVALAVNEVMEFKRAGGHTIVDVSNIGLGRDPEALYGISVETGVNIVMGSGYYYEAVYPDYVKDWTAEQIAEEIVNDITVGVGFRKIKAGVIGEVGVSELMQPNEDKSIKGMAIAQRKTGVGAHLHIFPWPVGGNTRPLGMEAIAIYEKAGGDIKKLSVNHMDVNLVTDMDYIMDVARTGAYLEFDNFGHEFYIDRFARRFVPGCFKTDLERVRIIRKLVDAGYADRILVSGDICHKNLLCAYGGWGYGHVLKHIIPMFMDEGFTDEEIDLIIRQNPADFLDSDKI